jgi:hypothetical protein
MPTCYNIKKGTFYERTDILQRPIPNFSMVIGFRNYGRWIRQDVGMIYYDKIIYPGLTGINLSHVDRLYLIKNPNEEELYLKRIIMQQIAAKESIKPMSAKLHIPGRAYVTGEHNAIKDFSQISSRDIWVYIGKFRRYVDNRYSWSTKDIDNAHVYTTAYSLERIFPRDYAVTRSTINYLNDIMASESEMTEKPFYDLSGLVGTISLTAQKTKKQFYLEIPGFEINIGFSLEESASSERDVIIRR